MAEPYKLAIGGVQKVTEQGLFRDADSDWGDTDPTRYLALGFRQISVEPDAISLAARPRLGPFRLGLVRDYFVPHTKASAYDLSDRVYPH